jgi:uncharacterized FlaG/YvyC family protein
MKDKDAILLQEAYRKIIVKENYSESSEMVYLDDDKEYFVAYNWRNDNCIEYIFKDHNQASSSDSRGTMDKDAIYSYKRDGGNGRNIDDIKNPKIARLVKLVQNELDKTNGFDNQQEINNTKLVGSIDEAKNQAERMINSWLKSHGESIQTFKNGGNFEYDKDSKRLVNNAINKVAKQIIKGSDAQRVAQNAANDILAHFGF